jgi:lipopolysaccharide export system permease protein
VLFQSNIRRELGKSFAATLVVLITIVMIMMLIRVLGLVTRGSVNPADVLMVLAYFMLGHLSTILTLCLFIAIVHTLSRMAIDNEMVIWHASGKGLSGLLSPVLRFSWPILLGVMALALVVWPWANQQSQKLRDQYEQRGDLERVAPGQFQESADGTRVFYIDKETGASTKRSNIFIYESRGNKESVVTASAGQIESINGRQFLILEVGQRVVIGTDGQSVEVSEFKQFGSLIKASSFAAFGEESPKSKSSALLFLAGDASSLGELAWRFSLFMAAVNFIVLGIALSASANSRQGKSTHYLMALFVFVIYYNFINIGQNWISSGRTSFSLWMVALHGTVLLAGITLLWWRHNNKSWRSLLTRQTRQIAAGQN